MQQRRLRLGDVLDDYCPRERRITNHAVVAMIDDQVKQTRCSTCDAEHEYKEARVPAPRRRKAAGALSSERPDVLVRPPADAAVVVTSGSEDELPPVTAESSPADAASPVEATDTRDEDGTAAEPEEPAHDVWGHRPLIRATLPRQDGQTPERKEPDFTLRQPGRFDNRNGQRQRGARPGRPGQGGQFRQAQGQPGSRVGGHGQRQGPGHGPRHGQGGPQSRHGSGQPGNRVGSPTGQRGGGRPGQPRGPRPGSGRKRGR